MDEPAQKKTAYIILGAFIFLAVYLYFNNDRIATVIAGNGINGVFWYVISDFKNWVIVLGATFFPSQIGKTKKLLAGVMIAFAADIISYPRLLTIAPQVSEAIRASLDWIIVNRLPLSYTHAHFAYYLIIPIGVMLYAFNIFGYKTFLSHIKRT